MKHFVENKHVTKDNLFPIPPLFRLIHEQSGTDWREMYRVFNMGHRMEIYVSPADAQAVIDVAQAFGIEARIVGHVDDAEHNQLTIVTENGTYEY